MRELDYFKKTMTEEAFLEWIHECMVFYKDKNTKKYNTYKRIYEEHRTTPSME